MNTPEERISYAVICEKMPNPCCFFGSYKEAVKWAKFDQPENRPFYIVKRVEHFEICGVVKDKGRK